MFYISVSSKDIPQTEELYHTIKSKTMFDDRENVNFGDKVKFSDYIGVPWKIIHGNGTYTIKNRAETCVESVNDLSRVMELLERIENGG